MTDVQRILDANANRAREAMRVMEDAARFLLDDAEIARSLKQLRHDLAGALGQLPDRAAVELHRDTPGDVGTTISTTAEGERASAREVAIAAGKRLSEALRCLEEYGKTLAPDFAGRMEALRYRGYDLETRLHRRLGSPHARQWRLCVLITEALCEHHDWPDVARACLDAGADCLQLREKTLEAGELLERAAALVELAADDDASIIVNDRPDVALLAGADGVHLGQNDLPPDAVRRMVGRRLAIGVSTHDLGEAKAAVTAGADYCGVGAMFATETKARRTSGPAYLRRFVRDYPTTPHLAIGGITPDNIDPLVAAGARGVAVSACVCRAPDPASVVRKLLQAMNAPS